MYLFAQSPMNVSRFLSYADHAISSGRLAVRPVQTVVTVIRQNYLLIKPLWLSDSSPLSDVRISVSEFKGMMHAAKTS